MNCFLSHKIDLNREMSDIIDVTRGLSVYELWQKERKKVSITWFGLSFNDIFFFKF